MSLYNYGTPETINDSWLNLADCATTENSRYFHAPSWKETTPEKEARELRAKEVCARCPVLKDCLEFVMAGYDPVEEVQAALSPDEINNLRSTNIS